EEPGQRDVVGPVAAADGEDLDVVAAEVLGDPVELVDRARLADDAVVAERACEAGGGARVPQGSPAPGVEYDADSRHSELIWPSDPPVVNAKRGSQGDAIELGKMDARAQVEAARRAVLAVPTAPPDLATLVVTGKDRVSWLNGLVTCDLAKR